MSTAFDLGAFMTAWLDWIHDAKRPAARFASIDETTRRLVAVWTVDGQIQNGGLAQAIATVPWMIADAAHGMRVLGEPAAAALLEATSDRRPTPTDDRAWWDRPAARTLDARLGARARRLAPPPSQSPKPRARARSRR